MAIGTTIIDKTKTEIPIKEATISIWVTKPLAPKMSRVKPKNNCKKILKKLTGKPHLLSSMGCSASVACPS